MILGSNLIGQNSIDDRNLFSVTDDQINEYINEVYVNEADALVYSNPQQLARIKKIFERIVVVKDAELARTNLPDLFDLPLASTYNKNLKTDFPFNPEEFNPLKYKMDVFRYNNYVYYRIGDSDYVIIIKSN